jgi:hypothetical protein
MKRFLTIALLLIAAAGLQACGAIERKFENRLACSLDRSEAYVVSKYGPLGVSSEIQKDDAALACKPPPERSPDMQKSSFQQYLEADLLRGFSDHRFRANRDDLGLVTFEMAYDTPGGQQLSFRVDGNHVTQWDATAAATAQKIVDDRSQPNRRVTKQQVEDATHSEHFHVPPGSTLTICVLTLQNGFMVTGQSACADPASFDAAVGRRLAREDAMKMVWMFEGYALRSALAAAANSAAAAEVAA